jgi:hypothetical protein
MKRDKYLRFRRADGDRQVCWRYGLVDHHQDRLERTTQVHVEDCSGVGIGAASHGWVHTAALSAASHGWVHTWGHIWVHTAALSAASHAWFDVAVHV